jgi:hypothetical protein
LDKIQRHFQQGRPPHSAPILALRQIKFGFFLLMQRKISKVLIERGNKMWTLRLINDNEWAISFSVLLMITLVMDKTLSGAYNFCENRIKHGGREAEEWRDTFQNLLRLKKMELFERMKEIFHWKFKTCQYQDGERTCNPIRDGVKAFNGKFKPTCVDNHVANFVRGLQAITEFSKNAHTCSLTFEIGLTVEAEHEVRSRKTSPLESASEYTDTGRLACIFLDDFLDS